MNHNRLPQYLTRAIKKANHIIDDFYIERDCYGECDGLGEYSVWIHFKEGIINPDRECGLIHEADTREALQQLNDVYKRYKDTV